MNRNKVAKQLLKLAKELVANKYMFEDEINRLARKLKAVDSYPLSDVKTYIDRETKEKLYQEEEYQILGPNDGKLDFNVKIEQNFDRWDGEITNEGSVTIEVDSDYDEVKNTPEFKRLKKEYSFAWKDEPDFSRIEKQIRNYLKLQNKFEWEDLYQ